MNSSTQAPLASAAETQDDDTIELVLNPVEVQHLSEAAQEGGIESPQIDNATVQCRESVKPVATLAAAKTRRAFVGLVGVAAVAAVVLGTVGDDAATLRQRAAIVYTEPRSSDPASAPAATARTDEAASVRLTNPFDSTEIFEFPAGTSEEDAHAAVAQLLANRARERRSALAMQPGERARALRRAAMRHK